MSLSLDDLKREAARLPQAERAELARAILDSLEAGVDDDDGRDEDVEEAWRQEVARRIEQIDRGEVRMVPLNEALDRVRRRFG